MKTGSSKFESHLKDLSKGITISAEDVKKRAEDEKKKMIIDSVSGVFRYVWFFYVPRRGSKASGGILSVSDCVSSPKLLLNFILFACTLVSKISPGWRTVLSAKQTKRKLAGRSEEKRKPRRSWQKLKQISASRRRPLWSNRKRLVLH